MYQALCQAQGTASPCHVVIRALHGVGLPWRLVKWGRRLAEEGSSQAAKCHGTQLGVPQFIM